MIESKSLTVPPSLENSTIDLWQNFGWELKSTQEINSKESHLEGKFCKLYSVTSTDHYVKLAFQRDTKMQNYARIKELETIYAKLLTEEPQKPKQSILDKILFWILPIFIPDLIRHKKDKDFQIVYNAWSEKMNTEGKQILDEATSLLA